MSVWKDHNDRVAHSTNWDVPPETPDSGFDFICICGDHCLDFGGCGEWYEDEGQNPPFTNVLRCGNCGCACGDA